MVLQEESRKNLGHGSSFSSQPDDSVAMYANSKGNSGNKGSNKERPLCTHCNMLGHTIYKCYKLHGYPPRYKPKGRSNANANQVSSQFSSNQDIVVDNSSTTSTQCPISKAQCEHLLAFLSIGTSLGDGHHAANVSASDGVSSMVYGGSGVTAAVGMGTSWAHHR